MDIALSLPFQGEVNTGFGVLAKVYLDALTHLNNQQRVRDPNAEGVREAKAMALEICEETFPGVRSPRMEVERGFRFWDVVSDRDWVEGRGMGRRLTVKISGAYSHAATTFGASCVARAYRPV